MLIMFRELAIRLNNWASEMIMKFGLALPYKKRMAMYRMLEKMTGEPANLQINEAIQELQNLENNKDMKTPLWFVYEFIMDSMRGAHHGFAGALSKFIPQQDTMIIAASEQDDITLGFSTVLENNRKTEAMKKAFKKALVYPAFLFTVLLGVIYYFSIQLIPVMAENIPSGANISVTSQFLIMMASTFYYWFSALIVFILLFSVALYWSLPNFSSKNRKYLENFPPFNMYRLMVGCGFMFALNSLSKAGYIQIDALEQMVGLSKPYLRHRIEILMDLMADGRDLGEALIYSKLDFPDKQMVRELAIQVKYSENDALEILSNTLAEDGLETIKVQATVLNTVVTMTVFTIIGFLYFSIFGLGMELGNVQPGIS